MIGKVRGKYSRKVDKIKEGFVSRVYKGSGLG